MNHELKFLRYVMQPEIRITGLSSLGLACSAVVYKIHDCHLSTIDMYWPALLALAYWTGRQSLEYSWSLLHNFFKSEMCILIYVHCDANIFKFVLFLIFWTLKWRHGSPKS
jgi:hypothetical protein